MARREFTAEFKREAVRLASQAGMTKSRDIRTWNLFPARNYC